MTYRFEHELALACRDELLKRVADLRAAGYSDDEDSPDFLSQLYLYERMLLFDWEYYPDFTCPWHLLLWEHCRWDHVYTLVSIIESLRQPTGSHAGQPIVLQPFQVMILFAFMAPEDPVTHLRLVREGLLTLARKQAKTALVSALGTAMMAIAPAEHGLRGQEIQVGAADREQAGITYMMAERYVSMDMTLGLPSRFRGVPSKKTLTHLNTLTSLRCLSSDAHRHHGGNPVIVLLDEIGNVSNALAQEFYSVLTTGFGAQDEPLTLLFSTQAPNDQHMFSQMVDKAKRLNEGSLSDLNSAGFVFTVPDVDDNGDEIDPFDPTVWRMASPGMGTIYNPRDMEDWAKRAKDMPSLQNKYENLKLNRRVSETSAFVSRVAWQCNIGPALGRDELYGRPGYLGLDLAETTDLCSLVLLLEDDGSGCLPVIPYYWIPGEDLQGRVHRDHVPYDVWKDQELIDTTSSKTVDYAKVAQKIVDLIQDFDIQGLGFDRYRMKYLTPELLKLGYEWSKEDGFLREIGQGFVDQSRTVEVLEGLILNGNLAHGDNPILKWNAGNAVVIKDPAGNRKWDKARSFGRIDGLVALGLAAHVRDLLGITGDGTSSIYTNMEIEVFM